MSFVHHESWFLKKTLRGLLSSLSLCVWLPCELCSWKHILALIEQNEATFALLLKQSYPRAQIVWAACEEWDEEGTWGGGTPQELKVGWFGKGKTSPTAEGRSQRGPGKSEGYRVWKLSDFHFQEWGRGQLWWPMLRYQIRWREKTVELWDLAWEHIGSRIQRDSIHSSKRDKLNTCHPCTNEVVSRGNWKRADFIHEALR